MSDWLGEAARFPEQNYPVETWHPQSCGVMDVVIRRDGVWLHEGRPITRPALVKLFSRLLRRDGDDYVLVTPVEKLKITVEDLPFRIVDFEGTRFTSDQGEELVLGEAHPLVVDVAGDEWRPRLKVRGNLWGRLTRACTQRLFETAQTVTGDAVEVCLRGQIFQLPIVYL